jgi:hypothetical protein
MKNPDSATECWVDIFEGDTFDGTLVRLPEGRHEGLEMPGSVIVGPGAIARFIEGKTGQTMRLGPTSVFPDLARRCTAFELLSIEVLAA